MLTKKYKIMKKQFIVIEEGTSDYFIVSDLKVLIEEMYGEYNDETENFYTKLNSVISKSKVNDIIFFPKLFLYPLGVNNSEVFSFTYNLWVFCTTNKLCPYKLDGIIFTGIEQKYSRDKRDHKLPIYKYKPPETNSD
jgi:hypothetical protein